MDFVAGSSGSTCKKGFFGLSKLWVASWEGPYNEDYATLGSLFHRKLHNSPFLTVRTCSPPKAELPAQDSTLNYADRSVAKSQDGVQVKHGFPFLKRIRNPKTSKPIQPTNPRKADALQVAQPLSGLAAMTAPNPTLPYSPTSRFTGLVLGCCLDFFN